MAESIMQCPQCQRPLRVTDELRNRMVKCPSCEATFTVPAGSDDPQPVGPPRGEGETVQPAGPRSAALPGEYRPRPSRGHPGPEDFYPRDRQQLQNAVQLPAIFLLITAILGLLANLGQVVYAALAQPQPPGPEVPEWLVKLQQDATGPAAAVIGLIFAVISAVVLVAAIQMLRLRTHGLALAGSILAMLNFGNCCCLLGLPVGIWALVVLLRPEVRAVFEGTS
jgi:predicted Zn finger-like uncharacterized protein